MATLELEPGKSISHFRLETKLGEGGMGAVFLAEDLTLSRPVAIKFMNRSLVAQQVNESLRKNMEQRFIREAKSAAAINHPNLAQIYEASFDTDNWYIAMEFIDGKALNEYMEDDGKPFPISEVVRIARQVAAGLSFAWDNYKIIHRDIKPQNIMLTTSNIVKIVDLGLAKPVASADLDYDMPELTNAGVPIGTPQYMAPEQATGDTDIDQRTDIFALGATLYEMCAGKKAFIGATAPLIYMNQIQKKYDPIIDSRAETPPDLAELIDKMLEPKPDDRLPGYPELEAVLSSIGAGITGDAVAGVPTLVSTATMQRGAPTMPMLTTIGVHEVDHLILDRYRVLKLVGKSQAGVVYHCMDTRHSVECAVKGLLPGREFPAEEMPRIRGNFQRLMNYSHTNLVQIRDLQTDEDSGEFYVVMEMLKGRNLREYIHRKSHELDTVTLADVKNIFSIVAEALDDANNRFNAIHHDIKPESVFLIENDTQVKLLDYGVTYCSSELKPDVDDDELFRYPLATPDYMAPEIWQRHKTDLLADEYSLAVVLYEVLSGKLPFWLKEPLPPEPEAKDKKEKKGKGRKKLSEYEQQQLKRLCNRVLTETPAAIPTLKPGANAAILKALSKDPMERHKNCITLVQAAAGSGTAGSRTKVIIAAVIVLLLIIAAVPLMGHLRNDGGKGSIGTPPNGGHVIPPPGSVENPPPSSGESPSQAGTGTETPVPATGSDPTMKTTAGVVQEIPPPVIDTKAQVLTPPTPDVTPATGDEPSQGDTVAIAPGPTEIPSETETRIREMEMKRRATLRQMGAAKQWQDELGKLRKKLEADEHVKQLVSFLDKMTKKGETALAAKDYKEAIAKFREAIEAGRDIENQVKQIRQDEIETLRKESQDWRDKAAKFQNISSKFAENVVEVDVSMSVAERAAKMEQFDTAEKEYKQLIEVCKTIIKAVDEKYRGRHRENWIIPKVNMELVWIAALGGWVGKYEVTNEQYRVFKPRHDSKKYEGFSLNKPGQPVVEVTYLDCIAFCRWLEKVSQIEGFLPNGFTFQVPTKDQWQTFARCGEERMYPWGNDWPPAYGNFGNQEVFPKDWRLNGYDGDKWPVTCPVDQSGGSEWGLFGVSGNAWEWTRFAKGGMRAVFGGAWTEVDRRTLVIAPKGNLAPSDEPFDNIGFRIILAPKEEE